MTEQDPWMPEWRLSTGLDHVVTTLRAERDDIASLERRLKAARARRKVLIAKLRYAGWTLRQIEPHAGISNAAISQQEQEPTEHSDQTGPEPSS